MADRRSQKRSHPETPRLFGKYPTSDRRWERRNLFKRQSFPKTVPVEILHILRTSFTVLILTVIVNLQTHLPLDTPEPPYAGPPPPPRFPPPASLHCPPSCPLSS